VKKQVLELVESCSKIDDRDEASRLLPSPSSPIFPAPLANYRPWYALTDKHAIQRRHLSPTKSTAQPPATHLHVATPVAAPRLSVASPPSPGPAVSPPPAAPSCPYNRPYPTFDLGITTGSCANFVPRQTFIKSSSTSSSTVLVSHDGAEYIEHPATPMEKRNGCLSGWLIC
jgi:hypothetical protein